MGRKPIQYDLFPGPTPLEDEIIARALSHDPVARYVGYSGGDDSLVALHLAMMTVPGCRPVSFITGIGVQATIDHRRRVCDRYGWDLLEIHAKEDCGQDYDHYVMKWGFPGPPLHQRFYNRLKGRCVEKLVRDAKAATGVGPKSRRKVMIMTGIRKDESQRRMGYGGREVNFVGSQMWVNPLYHRPKSWFMDYIKAHNLPRNPVSVTLGMSGECLCGAFAHKGELAMVRTVCPRTAQRIEDLQERVRAAGHAWGWEEYPPETKVARKAKASKHHHPLCVGCEKTPYMFEETAA